MNCFTPLPRKPLGRVKVSGILIKFMRKGKNAPFAAKGVRLEMNAKS
jgi:hypothetical protein